jgi:DNA-binding MarR family transcriptional regulator
MKRGWVEETDGPDDPVDERRRYYRLTRSGRQAVQTEAARLEDLVRAVRAHRSLRARG